MTSCDTKGEHIYHNQSKIECKNIQLRTILLVTLPDLYCGLHI